MKQTNIKDLKCPLLKHDCIGDKCMWWVEDSFGIAKLAPTTRKCAIARLAAFRT